MNKLKALLITIFLILIMGSFPFLLWFFPKIVIISLFIFVGGLACIRIYLEVYEILKDEEISKRLEAEREQIF